MYHTSAVQEGYPLTAQPEGSPRTLVPPPFCQAATSSEGSWCAACQGHYEDTRENGRAKSWRQSLAAGASLPPL